MSMDDYTENIIKAALEGNKDDIAKHLQSLAENHDLSQEEKSGLLGCALYESVTSGTCGIDTVELFKYAGADFDYTDQMNQSILLQSIHRHSSVSHSKFICHLVKNGANINHESINGQTDFLHLFSSGHLSNLFLVELIDNVSNILERDIRTGGTFLHLISNCQEENRIILIEKLLNKGVPIDSIDNNGDTSLHLMAGISDVDSIKCLIENGANIFAKNRLGETLFHQLASNNHLNGSRELTDLLLKNGLDINEKDHEGKSVMHHAMMSEETTVEAVKELLIQNLKINVRDSMGKNEIYCAVEEVNIEYDQKHLDQRAQVIKCLVEAGVSVNEQNLDGITPLHMATLKNDLEILVTLLDCGADVTQKTKTGATALHWACKNYNMLHVIIHFLLEAGHDLNVVDVYGSTALHWAVWFKEKSPVQTLLQVGCDYTIKDNSGISPETLAEMLDFPYFSSLIKDKLFEKMEYVELQEPNLECSGVDPLIACPHLRYVRKEKGKLDTEMYFDHLKLHKTSIQSCLQRSLTLKEMGLFYLLQDNYWVPQKFNDLFVLLAETISKRFPLFTCEAKLVGSMYEGTKVRIPNEFDYLFLFSDLPRFVSPIDNDKYPDNFVKLQRKSGIKKCHYDKYFTKGGFLDSQIFLQDFYKHLNGELEIILKETNEYSHIMLLKSLKEIWGSISELQFFVFGHEAKRFHASVDIVPALQFKGWTPKQLHQLDPNFCEYDAGHPMVIMKTPDRCHVKDFTLFYRVSFSYLEQDIIKHIPQPVKKGYILLKIFTESGYLPKVVDHDYGRVTKTYITSYHMKTCLLHEWYEWTIQQKCQGNVRSPYNQDGNTTVKWAKKILSRYQKSIDNRFLPSFFNPSKNLFGIDGLKDGMQEQDKFVKLVELLEHILNVALESN